MQRASGRRFDFWEPLKCDFGIRVQQRNPRPTFNMPTWNPDQYLKFADERTRPCRDLADRVSVNGPRRIIDLGCGPGNSTAVIADRWPDAEITGLDSSPDMIESAKKSKPNAHWVVGDIASWAEQGPEKEAEPYDVVFSNAALQWVQPHKSVFPRLLSRVAEGGALAAQMPGNFDGPAHRAMREIAHSPEFKDRLSFEVREWFCHDTGFYYDVLAPHASRLDIWMTEYLHIMPDAQGIVEWYKGTGLRPFLQALSNENDRGRFVYEYLKKIEAAYPARPNGCVLFPFQRIFIIAYK
ncbi:MAG TPA: trans-aconitate 2-methyltransferase [Blastocatellia bacterium]|nr:trans-aconitate 2-methyltransferase [Blastocatellia bacterium]